MYINRRTNVRSQSFSIATKHILALPYSSCLYSCKSACQGVRFPSGLCSILPSIYIYTPLLCLVLNDNRDPFFLHVNIGFLKLVSQHQQELELEQFWATVAMYNHHLLEDKWLNKTVDNKTEKNEILRQSGVSRSSLLNFSLFNKRIKTNA